MSDNEARARAVLDTQGRRDRRWRRLLILVVAGYVVATIAFVAAFAITQARQADLADTEQAQSDTIGILRCEWTLQGRYNVLVTDYLNLVANGEQSSPQTAQVAAMLREIGLRQSKVRPDFCPAVP